MTEQIQERYMLSMERIKSIQSEKTVDEKYRDYFTKVSEFIVMIDRIRENRENGSWETRGIEALAAENKMLYSDILGEAYEHSYANPEYAVKVFGEETGRLLSFLYTEIRGEIAYVFDGKQLNLTICNELFIEVYNCFEVEKEPAYEQLKDIVYWYASDYADVFVADQIVEHIDPDCDFIAEIVRNSDLNDLRYLYQYGEYISDNQIRTAQHLNTLPEELIAKMADTYTEGYRMGFVVGRKDLSKKKTVNVCFPIGFERVIRKAVANFAQMGLRPVMYRPAVSVLTKRKHYKNGVCGAIANKQYEYDHGMDEGLFLDKKFMERKLDVMKNTYENHRGLAADMSGPAVTEVFGEEPFAPKNKPESVTLNDKQRQLDVLYANKSAQLSNHYMKGEERSFTIIAYPLPEIGEQYEEIFNEVIRINTLDAKLYTKVQQTIIDALDQGDYVHILGKGANRTDMKINLYKLNDPEKETIFENCVADMNIPVGEVFTSPVLEGTEGTLHVSKSFLKGMEYRDIEISFKDGMITEYTCRNFEEEEENKKYLRTTIMNNHETLPIGEFAIGTNTTAYVVAKKYGIEEKLPVLIGEKMGPHFAVGDTCYSWSEDVKMYNLDGKEIVAKENTVSVQRHEDPMKAYFQVHVDITVPYEELESIDVVRKDGSKIAIIADSRFVLPGTEMLNEPLKELEELN